jgi:hypothetical protein
MKKPQVLIGAFVATCMFAQGQAIRVTSGVAGQSGLNFANLNSTSPLLVNPGTGVLALNGTGDVILVPDQQGVGTLGGANNGCSLATGNFVQLGN